MKNPDGLNREELESPQEQVAEAGIEQAEETRIEEEIREVQAELREGVGELNEHLDELEELQSDESLSEKAKNVLMAGIKEIKDYVSANSMVNMLAGIAMAGTVGESIRELASGDKDIKEVATTVLGGVVFWGIAKAVAYLGWGRKAQQQEMARAERDNEAQEAVPVEDGEVVEAQPVEEVEEALPSEDDTENQIKKLKNDLDEKYKDKTE
ncbi:MAG: hypothetical protein A3C50_00155 [Candidatus Staskawiczbacteria bacterium RIFCSPHIGHO2_02_FULL_43_16]|uniref:Uncharacterized protein n=1 Tax=Candidatus Staskawiczbacteria bacterium RIFCSPHIGHO2_01_FULL_41_41 TaxID=1802203 RepID=A0A1G2HW47_9BACT|nr:MAG: hypothetical protein A2822_01820 [Candidatus Staskawiczbacteria bacterium RIFCSPHIGHO2_01_FULL_41_41]OGZ68906.1 MAG: hypothetical protein A3C50_00155 [Candidatus Staskawiczbacteria bacterium RIFCSPHIGHO2_02_FULL_43_16]OGZ74912.1 MAG: hypothetical protein A3A12_03660 [Candidatus Staskawiczbacteria bacterium RIFCSPLOWO2_01_FULL_43_17b]